MLGVKGRGRGRRLQLMVQNTCTLTIRSARKAPGLEFLAAQDGAAESGCVGELQIAADRETVGDPGHL